MRKKISAFISLVILIFFTSLQLASISAPSTIDGRFLKSASVNVATTSTGILGTANGGTGQNNLTNLPLTTPLINTGIKDVNGLNLFIFSPVTSAVNNFTFSNAITGNTPTSITVRDFAISRLSAQ